MEYLVLPKKGQLNLYSVFIASRWFTSIDDYINLEMSSPRFYGNMEKFHYNPIPLNTKTREFFSHLKTLYIYNRDKDEKFENDKRIIAREECKNKKYDLFRDQSEIIEKWTKKSIGSVVFDSSLHQWNIENSEFESRVLGKKNLTFLIEDKKGNKFGYYLSTTISKYGRWIPTGRSTFLFSLEKSGKTDNPTKFEIRFQCQGYWLYPRNNSNLIELGDIALYKENYKNKCYCEQDTWNFNYHGITNAFCGKKTNKICRNGFEPKRILVVQME